MKWEGMFSLETPNTVSSIFSICLTLLLALNGVEGGVFSTEIMKSLYWHVCAFRSAFDTAHVVNCSCICCEQIELFLSLVRITLACDYLFPMIGVAIFCEGLDYSCIFVMSFSLNPCVDLGLFAKGRNIWLIPFHEVKLAAYQGLFL